MSVFLKNLSFFALNDKNFICIRQVVNFGDFLMVLKQVHVFVYL